MFLIVSLLRNRIVALTYVELRRIDWQKEELWQHKNHQKLEIFGICDSAYVIGNSLTIVT